MDAIKLQKLIADYKASHPAIRNNTDCEIISIMCGDSSVNRADVAELSQLLANTKNTVGDNFTSTNAPSQNSDVKPVIVSANGKNYNLNKTIELRINRAFSALENAENGNGFIGKTWSGLKNLAGIGDSSDNVRQFVEKERKLLNAFNSNMQKRPQMFKELTGLDYTPENLEKFIKGQIKLQSEIALDKYKEGQETAVDITTDIVSGIVSYGTAAACIAGGIAAAPFTGGTSLSAVAVGVGIATGTGAVTKVVLKAMDAYSGGREYTLKEAGKDAVIGGVSGALAPVTMGTGGAVLNSAAKVAPKVIANTARYSVEGGMFGFVDGGTRAALDGESAGDIAIASLEGAAGGVLAGNILGHSGNAIGKAFNNTKAVRNANKAISSIENNRFSHVKLDAKDKDAILYILKQGIDLRGDQLESIVKFLKQNPDYAQADIEMIVSLFNKFEASSAYRVVKLFQDLNFEDSYEYITPQKLKNILQEVKDLPPEVVQSVLGEGRGDCNLISITETCQWIGNSLALFTKILPESKNLSQRTLEYLIRITNAYQKGGVDVLDSVKIKELMDVLTALTSTEKEILKRAGLDVEILMARLNPKLTGFEVRVGKVLQNRFLKTIVGNNNPVSENVISGRMFKSYLLQLENNNASIPLKYSRQEFTKDLEKLLAKLSPAEREKVLRHLNIELNNSNFSGFVKADDFNYGEFSPESESILRSIRTKVEHFVLKNETDIANPEIKQMLDDLIQGFPEFTSIIGKLDADHSNRLEVHILQVLSEAISHPDYKKLTDFEKTMLKFSILMHDLGKIEGQKTSHWEQSAVFARSILDKFPLSQEMKEGIVNLIRYHHFGERQNQFYNYFRTPEQQHVAKILGDSDAIARFKTNRSKPITAEPLAGLADALNITHNSTAVIKYPKRTYTLQDGRKVSVGVSDMRKVSYDADASTFGWYSGKSLRETTVQVHNCKNTDNIKEILLAYQNPNKDITLSTTVTKLDKIQENGYGKISLILSTSKGNNVVVASEGAGNALGGKKGFNHFLAFASSEESARKQFYMQSINEVFALNPKVEQIALKDVAPENIPLDLIELAAEHNIPIVLLP